MRVLLVDDEKELVSALAERLVMRGIEADWASTAEDALEKIRSNTYDLAILDVKIPRMSGIELKKVMEEEHPGMHFIFMTGHGDIPMSVRAMKAGAVDFLSKPFRDQDMLDAVTAALERDAQHRAEAAAKEDIRAQYETLTAREREVMGHVTAGLMNKQVAALIGLSEITVKIHRGNVMRKMGVRSLADLVRKAEALGVSQTRRTTDQT